MDFLTDGSLIEVVAGAAVILVGIKAVGKISKFIFTVLLLVGGYMVLNGVFGIDVIKYLVDMIGLFA